MGKKKSRGEGSGLGRALIKERLNAGRGTRRNDSWLHTSELNDGYDWGRLNLQSVTEQSSLDDFLATAELAGTEFVAEKLNIKFVPAESRAGLLTAEESKRLKKLHEDNKQFLRIPRRPHWDENTSPEVLQQAEKDSFLEWRRQLAVLEEEQKLILTPFERNLDFWRQLWRVIERSDIVIQIVDARNPLLFRCPDLEKYVKEVSEHKVNMLLLNKADLLTREQRRTWAQYFQREGVRAAFWSALAEGERLDAEEKGEDVGGEEESDAERDEAMETSGRPPIEKRELDERSEGNQETEESDSEDERRRVRFEDCVEEGDWQTCSEISEDEEDEEETKEQGREQSDGSSFRNSSRLLRKQELLDLFKSAHSGTRCKEGQLTVGLVGYPNVGKSSTINTILRNKKVSVSATPGHTKHFQTLFVEPGLCLCDCPGLVMPSFVSTKAEMICSGILPIDQMRDHVPAVSLVCQTIPRAVLEGTYGINIIRPREDEEPDRPPTSEEFLTAYGYMRGFMTTHGQPDQSRSARYVLKDYVSGKLLYCHPPPHVDAKDFQPQHKGFINRTAETELQPSHTSNKQPKVKRIENTVDKSFFHQENVRALTKGVQTVMGYKPGSGPQDQGKVGSEQQAGKPWKKHGNRNKKEKLRRINKHLDA
ncbi:large subunit GTPase 1 homolog [Chanos chanos]|uniref:Large subunit GTPase 1 homolog n=1 Tax=Chanos chanos TaxID=29144 RepID=A0A6J2WSQ9_CHACN|nr:large subunit GTPase 1 homolog [Chanos chanos]